MQRKLSREQLEHFYQYCDDDTQASHFLRLVPHSLLGAGNVVVDMGGGSGFFASSLKRYVDARIRIIDMDPVAVETCRSNGLDAVVGDALVPKYQGDENVVCFNLMLHHMVGATEQSTLILQRQIVQSWINRASLIFVNELIYDSYFGTISGRLIYLITRSKILSKIALMVSRFVPSLHANTFGTGVRFRAREEWVELFERWGFRVVASIRGEEKDVPLARRVLFIKSFRQDSFLLASALQSD